MDALAIMMYNQFPGEKRRLSWEGDNIRKMARYRGEESKTRQVFEFPLRWCC
jgi:hypothetical protein